MEKINLLEKLAKARVDFQAANIKKSGKNKHMGFDYYELHDILPKINDLSKHYRFLCAVSFNPGTAVLKIFDIDDPAQILEFSSPMAGVQLKGAHDIQNMGAVQTYMRRYLYMAAFEITECDFFDCGQGSAEKTPPPSKPQNGCEVRAAVLESTRVILSTLNPDGFQYFNDTEKKIESKIAGKARNFQDLANQNKRLKSELAKRVAAFKPIPFEEETGVMTGNKFTDDYPFEESELPSNKNEKEIEIF